MKLYVISILIFVCSEWSLAIPAEYKYREISGTISHAVWRGNLDIELITATKNGAENLDERITFIPHVMLIIENINSIKPNEASRISGIFTALLPPIDNTREKYVKKFQEQFDKGEKIYLLLPLSKENMKKIKIGSAITIQEYTIFNVDFSINSVTAKKIVIDNIELNKNTGP